MNNIAEICNFITEKLKPINPSKIILFGSYAYGNPGKDSDIDLLVVTSDKIMPANYKERMDLYLKVSYLLSELNKNYPVDLLVYTEPMYESFISMGSLFSREITQKGKLIYENNNTAMA